MRRGGAGSVWFGRGGLAVRGWVGWGMGLLGVGGGVWGLGLFGEWDTFWSFAGTRSLGSRA